MFGMTPEKQIVEDMDKIHIPIDLSLSLSIAP